MKALWKTRRRWSITAATMMLVIAWCGITAAQDAPTAVNAATQAAAAVVEPAPAAPATPNSFYRGVDTGSTAWMLVSSALVLFMVPGLALFYGGMVRSKNVLNMFL